MLVLLRHGETAANAARLLLGRADPPLTPLGARQAEATRRALLSSRPRPSGPGGPRPSGPSRPRPSGSGPSGVPSRVSRLVSSPLVRARRTAEALDLGLPVEVDERWVELDYGNYDGQPLDRVPGDLWQRWRADPGWRPDGGESLDDVARRVGEACCSLAGEAAEADVVVVSHVSPIKAAAAWALGVGIEVSWRLHLGLAAISRIDIRPAGPVLVAWNETRHLELVEPEPGPPGARPS